MMKWLSIFLLIPFINCNTTTMNVQTILSTRTHNFKMADEHIELLFSVQNLSNDKVKICSYHTPFEGVISDMFMIIDPEGKTLEYKGIMVKRGKPRKRDSTSIKGNETLSTLIDIKEGYELNVPGIYSVQFKGETVYNLLPESNTIQLLLE